MLRPEVGVKSENRKTTRCEPSGAGTHSMHCAPAPPISQISSVPDFSAGGLGNVGMPAGSGPERKPLIARGTSPVSSNKLSDSSFTDIQLLPGNPEVTRLNANPNPSGLKVPPFNSSRALSCVLC